MPRIQSWPVTTTSSAADDAIVGVVRRSLNILVSCQERSTFFLAYEGECVVPRRRTLHRHGRRATWLLKIRYLCGCVATNWREHFDSTMSYTWQRFGGEACSLTPRGIDLAGGRTSQSCLELTRLDRFYMWHQLFGGRRRDALLIWRETWHQMRTYNLHVAWVFCILPFPNDSRYWATLFSRI